jgi:hypothetical protein
MARACDVPLPAVQNPACFGLAPGSGRARRPGPTEHLRNPSVIPAPACVAGRAARIPGASTLPDAIFNLLLASRFQTSDGKVNLEAITLPPLFIIDDHWWFATLASVRDPATGLTLDMPPPYAAYASNANHVTPWGNPFAATLFHDRWYVARCPQR